MVAQYETRLFLNGEFVDSAEKKTFDVRSAASGEILASVQLATSDDIDAAVKHAEAAQPAWADLPASARADCLRKLADLLEAKGDPAKEMDALCMGRPIGQQFVDVFMSARRLRWDAAMVESLAGESIAPNSGTLGVTMRVPYGVTAAIIPWNVPMMMWASKIGPSVAAGNAIILKSSEKSPLGALYLASLTAEAGFPPGIIQVVSGAGETGKLLSEHMKIRKISFTGSTRTGKAIASAAALSNLKEVTMELGGKSPTLIFADADIEKAVAGTAFSVQWNSGQVCIAGTRLYVHEEIFDSFLEKFKAAYGRYTLGDPVQKETTLGPLVDEAQGKQVLSYIDIGLKDGKKILGGERVGEKGYFVQPTVFVDIPEESRLNKEEVFGPVVIIHKFTEEEEVIKRANNTEFGLYASVFTQDISRALRVAKKLEAGTVGVNGTSPMAVPVEMSFGGMKQSGQGRETGIESVKRWTEEKAVVIMY
ncbi:betaine-aldehyde dehydrogenase [Meredithblackwellia eburnea MCA 4105]